MITIKITEIMKQLHYLWMVAALLLTTTSLTSCLGDNGDSPDTQVFNLTRAQRMQGLNAATGSYNGWIFFYNEETRKSDSTAVAWQIAGNDSTLAMEAFPVKQFANYTSDNMAKDVLNNAGSQQLALDIHMPYVMRKTDWEAQFYQYIVVPKDKKLSFTYKGKTCELSFIDQYLQTNQTTYYPVMQYYKGKNLFYLLVRELKVDGATYAINTAVVIRTKI